MTTSTMTTSTTPGHVTIDPAILYWGTPVVLISTCNEDGSANLAPISSAFWLGSTAVLGFGLASHTLANLRRTGELVLNLPSADQVDAVDRLALTTGAPDVNRWKRAAGYAYEPRKFARAGLTPVASAGVAAPRAGQCPVAMEARVLDVRLTDVALVTAEVERVHVHPGLRLAGHRNRVDPDAWRPLIMSFQRFYGLGGELQSSRLATVDEEHYRS
jgi:flavin reductase (DIM6/NTAB) family NADH-FMN oxidoreductase RutF